MIKIRKRIALVLIGVLFIVASLVWMNSGKDGANPISAFVFTAGLIAVFGTVKRMLLDTIGK